MTGENPFGVNISDPRIKTKTSRDNYPDNSNNKFFCSIFENGRMVAKTFLAEQHMNDFLKKNPSAKKINQEKADQMTATQAMEEVM